MARARSTTAERLGVLEHYERFSVPHFALSDNIDSAARLFRRAPEQLVDRSGRVLRASVLQNPWEAYQAANPGASIERFLAQGVQAGTEAYEFLEALLGPASLRLLQATDVDEYVEALGQAFADFRTMPTPFDGGVSYGAWRYTTPGAHLDLPTDLNVLPMNAPVSAGRYGFNYPTYQTAATRGHRAIGVVMASRIWTNADVPLRLRGAELFNALNVRSVDAVHGWDYDPDFLQSEVQVAYAISSGDGWTYDFAIKPATEEGTLVGERVANQARWELAARHRTSGFISARQEDLHSLAANYPRMPARSGSPGDLSSRYARDPFYRLSDADLLLLAVRDRRAPSVEIRVYQWEHHRPQRGWRTLLRWADRVDNENRSGAVWRARLSQIAGISEPNNLFLLSPYGHAREDIQAAFGFGGKPTRPDRWGNYAYPTPEGHPDMPRADEFLVAYDPVILAELASTLREQEWVTAIQGLNRTQRDQWNQLARRINVQLEIYGMDDLLLLQV